jgi:hypothetical protein
LAREPELNTDRIHLAERFGAVVPAFHENA